MTSSGPAEASEGGVSSGAYHHKTLAHALKYNAANFPDHILIDWVNSKCEIESSITYQELWQHSSLVAALLVQNGVQRGDQVMIEYPFGLWMHADGVIACSVYPPDILNKNKARFSFEQFNNQNKDVGANFALTSIFFKCGLFVVSVSGHKTGNTKWLATDKLKKTSRATKELQDVTVSSNDIAFIQCILLFDR